MGSTFEDVPDTMIFGSFFIFIKLPTLLVLLVVILATLPFATDPPGLFLYFIANPKLYYGS